MVKELLIDPAAVRSPRLLEFEPVPINAYQSSVSQAKAEVGGEGMVGMLRDIALAGTRNNITTPAEMEGDFFSGATAILDVFHAHLRPLTGYESHSALDRDGLLARAARGV